MVTEYDAPALVLRVFARYLSLMRRVQTTYWCVARRFHLAAGHLAVVRRQGSSAAHWSVMDPQHTLQNRQSCNHPIGPASCKHAICSLPAPAMDQYLFSSALRREVLRPEWVAFVLLPYHGFLPGAGWSRQVRTGCGAWTTTSSCPSSGAPRS